jgi:hypothetical protein
MTLDQSNNTLRILAEAPPHQIDETIVARLMALIDKPLEEQEIGLQAIMDDCAKYSLASDFAMLAMGVLLTALQEEVYED